MKYSASLFWVTLFCLGIALRAYGQDYQKMRKELVQKQQDTRNEIEELNHQISQFEERLVLAEQKYDRLYKQFENLTHIIALQEEKISKLEEEQQHIREEITLTGHIINKNEQELEQLINDYKKTLRYIYKHGRTSRLALIFASESINQMLVRSYYLKKFESYRQMQAQKIEETQEDLKNNKSRLEKSREKNAIVLAEIQAEQREQEKKKEQQEKNVALLRQNSRQIQAKLDEYRQQKEKLNNTLTALILEEEQVRRAQETRIRQLEEERQQKLAEARTITDAEERAREVARYSTPVSRAGFLDEAALREIGASFAAGKGALPWPVGSSTISEHFGRRRHPVYGTVTLNPGIEIVTPPREPVHVIHNGHVVAIQPITGYGNVIVVRHGKYYTAYGNLSRILVRENSALQQGDIIGLAGDENSPKGKTVFFMVRENNTNLNPENWIKEK